MSVRTAVLRFVCVGAALLAGTISAFAQAPQQEKPEQQQPKVFFPMAEQPEMEMHHHGQIPEVIAKLPQLGNSQRGIAGPVYELPDLQKMAEENNPTLVQARRAVDAARGQKLQAGLLPNPTIGYKGDEIRGGSYGGGEQGVFVEQTFILGGKLGLDRKAGAAAEKVTQTEAETQRQRIDNDVSTSFYHVLAAQERLALERDLLSIAQTTTAVFRQLGRVGQADETEILQAEADEQKIEVAAGVAAHQFRREWAILTAVIGVPTLAQGSVGGRIDAELPTLDENRLLTSLLSASPELLTARAKVEQAEVILQRATRETVPDVTVRGGFQQNSEQLANPLGPHDRKVGLQGFGEVGLHLHLWDRNHGGIAAERADLEAARAEVTRVELMLRNRFAIYGEDYDSAHLAADKYHGEILPRLERAYKLMAEQYGLMTASYVRVLSLQRKLYENESAYIDALERTWTTSIALRGFLLEGALDAPGSMRSEERQRNRMEGPAGGSATPAGMPFTSFSK